MRKMVLEKTDLSGLTCDQRQQVRALIKEESSVFSVDADDFDNVTSPQMQIHLSDKTPVQQNCNSVTKTFHDELKNYIEDLLNKKWIINSQSSYSSPVVAIRKKRWIITTLLQFPQTELKDLSRLAPNTQDKKHYWQPPASVWPSQQKIYSIHHAMGLLWMSQDFIWVDECPSIFSKIYGTLPWGLQG